MAHEKEGERPGKHQRSQFPKTGKLSTTPEDSFAQEWSQPPNLTNKAALSPGDVFALHHLIGNQKVARMLRHRTVQRQGDGDVVNMPPLNVTGDRGGSIDSTIP